MTNERVPRLLLITGLWPTPDVPHAGIFVKRRVGDLPVRVISPSSYRGSMTLRYIRLAASALFARGRFDGVEAHPLFPAGLIGLLVARLRHLPLVTYAHGADVRETATRNLIFRFLARLVVNGSSAVITNSNDTATYVSRLGGRPIIIAPGVDLEHFRPSPRPATRRVLYLGGNDPGKGYEIAAIHADTLLGPGLETIAPDHIPHLLAEHDVLLVPSVAEGFGLVAAEAIASGRWVVASNVGGLREVVEEGVTGNLVSDRHGFEAALASVPDYSPDVVAARARRFSQTQSIEALTRVWQTILGSHPPKAPDRDPNDQPARHRARRSRK
jgi:glycosyltransferase involved in cell wall biosynthesis